MSLFHTKIKKTKNKQPATNSMITQLLTAMTFFSLGSMFLTFSTRMKHNATVPIYAPKSGFYFELYHHFGTIVHSFIIAISQYIHSPFNVAWSIIIVTLLFKFAIMPFSLFLSAQSAIRREKLAFLNPQLTLINNYVEYEPLTKPQRLKLDNLKKQLLKVNKLPQHLEIYYFILAIITSFITIPLYQSIAYASDIKQASFFSFNLAQRSIMFALFVALLAGIVSIVRFLGMSDIDRQFTPTIDYFATPLMLFCSSFFLPSVLCLYWASSQLANLIYAILSWHIFKPVIHYSYVNFKQDQIITLVTPEKLTQLLNEPKQ